MYIVLYNLCRQIMPVTLLNFADSWPADSFPLFSRTTTLPKVFWLVCLGGGAKYKVTIYTQLKFHLASCRQQQQRRISLNKSWPDNCGQLVIYLPVAPGTLTLATLLVCRHAWVLYQVDIIFGGWLRRVKDRIRPMWQVTPRGGLRLAIRGGNEEAGPASCSWAEQCR